MSVPADSGRNAKDASRIDRTTFIIATMDGRLPLPTLLPNVLVAITIEFDNEFEHQMPHRTTHLETKHGSGTDSCDAPWLVSLVMWSNYLRFVDEGGVRVREFQVLARLTKKRANKWLARLGRWWGHVVVAPDPADTRPNPPYSDWVVTRPSTPTQNAYSHAFFRLARNRSTRI